MQDSSIGRVVEGGPRASSCIVDRCSTSGPRHAPSQIPRRPIAQSRGAIICFFVSIHFC